MHDTYRQPQHNPDELVIREIAEITHDQFVSALRDTPDILPKLEEMLCELDDEGRGR